MKSFLVTGIGGPAGRNVSALLLDRQHRVIGTDMRNLAPKGVAFYQVPPANSPDFLAAIGSIVIQERVDLVIPTVSEELPVFAQGWEGRDEIPVLVSSAQAVGIANDKFLTSNTLHAIGVTVPRFILPSQVHSPDEVAREIGWPCISKPRVGRGGREVIWHEEQDWPAIAALSDRYILQEFASGTDYAPNLFVGPQGEVKVVVLEKTELKGGRVGNAKKVKRVEDADVARLAIETARGVGLIGPLDIDIRCRADGMPVVLEINARFGANIRHAPEIMDAMLSVFLDKT